MLINKCKTDLNEFEYTPQELNKIKLEDSNNKLIHHLFCIGCGVQLTFTMASENKRAFLKTKNKKNHEDNCSAVRTVNVNGNYKRTPITETVELTSLDKDKKRKYLYKKLHSKKDKKENSRKNNFRRKITQKNDKTDNKDKSTTIIGTNNSEKVKTNNEKHKNSPRAKYIAVQKLTSNMVGNTYFFYGYLNYVNINKNYVELTVNYNENKLKIYSSVSFLANDKYLKKRVESLKLKINTKKERPEVFITAEVQRVGPENFEAVFYNENDLGFPTNPLIVYLDK